MKYNFLVSLVEVICRIYMNNVPPSRNFPQIWRLATAALAMLVLSLPSVAVSQCLSQLKGKTYVNLPQSVCPRYTDMLLGQPQAQQQYGGVICDRPDGSYILLQKLLNYTHQGKAVWQVVQVQQVIRPTPQSFVKGIGCQYQRSSQPSAPIFALVQPTANNTYLTLAAWTVDFSQSSFQSLEPKNVVCQDLFL